ncbi:cobalamin biosynthesis protein CbiX [Intrasporangium oryzae NRRL B-24470]|uniref:Cobalamin biosynthesis protein CbiX n=1 Tax=Intrasporangium oryzae NRRL B-24470 TaxID=1386089 RepID=W9G166_9MICO|nr:CbiX/SirB N-terminal domain-containing protein [Intrasporangium oryzae]EWS99679.1 cobalamin biosynthesis protein CbiX [Intrasporangium oryzae NRRL B-24470]
MLPVLVAASHGTASPEGQCAVAGLVEAVARRRPDVEVRAAFVDVQQPDPAAVLEELDGRPARLVPLLLSAGYHVFVDLTEAARAVPGTTVAGALGPDPRLAELLRGRLERAGLRPDDVVVLAAAGSSQASAVDDCRRIAAELARLIGRPVTAGFLSAAEPRLDDAVAAARVEGRRVVVATYLLAPGFFADLAARAGADVVTEPLLLSDEPAAGALVDIVVDRYLS